MENEMTVRVAKAIQAELRRQGVLWEDGGEDPSRLMTGTGEVADLTAVVRAAIKAMREPTEAMVQACGNGECGKWAPGAWITMIEAALAPAPHHA